MCSISALDEFGVGDTVQNMLCPNSVIYETSFPNISHNWFNCSRLCDVLVICITCHKTPCFCTPAIYFILFMFGCVGSSLLCAGFLQSRRAVASLVAVRRPLIVVASPVAEHGLKAHGLQYLWLTGSRAQAQ